MLKWKKRLLIKRILPRSVAGTVCIGLHDPDRDDFGSVEEILTSDDFYQSQYGIIFDAMVELCNEGKPVDLIASESGFEREGTFHRISAAWNM